MWYVITKLVANCKNDVYLIKMINFKVVVLFIKILIREVFIDLPKKKSFTDLSFDNILQLKIKLLPQMQPSKFDY